MQTVSGEEGELARFFLDGLRRDAFVMEVGAYRDPVLPKDNEFLTVFASFWERVRELLKWPADPCLTCIAQVEYRDGSFEMLVTIQQASTQERVFARWSPEKRIELDGIAKPLAFIRESLAGHPAIVGKLAPLENVTAQDVAVVRYFVRPVLDGRDKQRAGDLAGLYALEPVARARGFVNTDSFASLDLPTADALGDAYYTAIMGLAGVGGCALSNSNLKWLEALHVQFQLSWGFPLLAQQREELVRQQEEADLERRSRLRLQHQMTQLEDIRVAAMDLSDTIEKQIVGRSHRLLGLLDPGTMLDNSRVFAMFDSNEMDKGTVFWQGASWEDRVRALHDPDEHDKGINQRFVACAIHLMLGTPDLHALRTSTELIEEARAAVNAGNSEPGLMALLAAALAQPYDGHSLLKEICFAPKDTSRNVSMFAIAMRLALAGGVHNQRFKSIVYDANGNQISLTRSQLSHEALFNRDPTRSRQWYEVPEIFGIKGVRHIEWIRPFIAVVGNGLQHLADHHEVEVSTVHLKAAGTRREISCEVTELRSGGMGHVAEIFDSVLHMTAVECGTHNLRGPLHQFRERARKPDLGSRLKATVEQEANTFTVSFV